MELSKDFGATLRAELTALFGIRWDSFIDWAVITWLSVWFWAATVHGGYFRTSGPGSPRTNEEFVGPIAGIKSFLHSIDISSPSWFDGILEWLHSPDHSWIYWVALLASVVTSVTAARTYKHTGLRVLALLTSAIACEVQGTMWPVLWAMLIAAIPALTACSLDWIGRLRETRTRASGQFYYAEGILITFITGIVFLFIRIPLAPFLIAMQLVVSFRTEIPRFAAAEITREVAREIGSRKASEDDRTDALTQTASAAALSLAGNQSQEAREILSHYSHLLRQRRESLDLEERRKNDAKKAAF